MQDLGFSTRRPATMCRRDEQRVGTCMAEAAVLDVDYARLFAQAPSAYAVVDADLVIVEVNRAYCAASSRSREQLLGTRLVSSFPDNPAAPQGSGSQAVAASLRRVLAGGRAERMVPQRYDVLDPATGRYVERHWSIVNVPVVDEDGRVVLVLHRPEEITEFVVSEGERGQGTRAVVDGAVVGGDALVRAQELQAAWQAEAAARVRLTAVSDVALRLSRAQSVQDLTGIVVGQGLAALGADGGAVGVRNGDRLDLAITSSLGEHTQTEYAQLPLDGPLPACVAAASGRPVVLPDEQASLAWAPQMRQVLGDTGCQAWVSLPLRTDGPILGSLTIGWAQSHEFGSAEMDVLGALAAQCGYGLERIQARQAEQVAAQQTRRMSEVLQRSMLTAPFQPDHLELAVRYVPAAADAQVGGDWYDAFMVPSGALCLAVGDVAGHDRDAAAAMGQLRNLLRGIACVIDEPPSAILGALDAAMGQLAVSELATAVFGKIEQTPRHAPGWRTFRWSSAGHPPPVLVGPDGAVRLLDARPDRLLGARFDQPRHDHEQLLEPGSTLLLYTDGLVERRGADLDTGFDWLVAEVTRRARAGLDELCDGLLDAIGGSVDDDVALLAVRAHPED
ncbi:SpoIIE family protein phosphatase [Pseudonocardia humida]|uniref:SpoIIE family protein phosphatase n=1 Tax=Pseudonocardia humida TaxID=2800819 RepID=A0ABT1AA86_9PSEU|nr:SpoIIE family protein phosphatase [Pseudonocardia humida]MCO1659957.1 SpoIIE family protein phosphatase [Pseudonocardia humida]